MAREAKGMVTGAEQLVHGETPPEYRGWLQEYEKPDPSWWTTAGRATTAIGGPGLAGLAAPQQRCPKPPSVPQVSASPVLPAQSCRPHREHACRTSRALPSASLADGPGQSSPACSARRPMYAISQAGIATPIRRAERRNRWHGQAVADDRRNGALRRQAPLCLNFDPASNTFRAALARISPRFVQSPGQSSAQWNAISNGVQSDLPALARARGGSIKGADFAEYIRGLNSAARAFAESAAAGSERAGDLRTLARSLNAITEAMETSAIGPASAKAERAAARQAWSRFMLLNDAKPLAVQRAIGRCTKSAGGLARLRLPGPLARCCGP
jgi:hypothetical protein